ncbi:hypothetical protein ACHAWC_011797 [Mediolabrus comicus]
MKSLVTKPAQTLVSKLGLGRSRDKSKDQQQQSSPVVLPKKSPGVGGGGRSSPSNNATTTTQQQKHAKTPLLSNATSDSTAASEADTVSIEVTPTIIPLSRSGAPQLKKLGSNTQRQQQRQQHGGGGILHQPHAHHQQNISNNIQSNNNNNNNISNGSITTSRVRFAPTSHKYSSQSSITSNTTSQSSHQVHLMALGGSQSGTASVASASVVSKDSIFDRVLREENERLNAMGMGERDFDDPYCLVKGGVAATGGSGSSTGGSGKGVGSGGGSKRDGMRGGRRVEI